LKSLYISPEPFPERGGAPASKIREAKKVGSVKEIELLFREAIQNSNDQRLTQNKPLRFRIEVKKLNFEQKAVLKGVLDSYDFDRPIRRVKFLKTLNDFLRKDDSYILIFADAGTKGLNGPISAAISSAENNFSNFFFKIGRAVSASDSSGGNKGEGRGVFFLYSLISSVLVYTRISDRTSGKAASRFFGMTLDEDFEEKGTSFTGHWYWGRKNGKKGAAPIEGNEASALGDTFGLSEFIGEDFGTAIGVLLPRYIDNDKDAELFARNMQFVAEKVIWPHLVPTKSGFKSIEMDIVDSSESVFCPDPLSPNSAAFRYAKLYQSNLTPNQGMFREVRTEFASSFSKDGRDYFLEKGDALGVLYWNRDLVDPKTRFLEVSRDEDPVGLQILPDYLSGIAFYRSPRLIVEYFQTELKNNEIDFFGYFEASEKANFFFRESEEGSHDQWLSQKLQLALGKARPNPVKRLHSVIQDVVSNIQSEISKASNNSVEVALMHEFGEMLDVVGSSPRGSDLPPSGNFRSRPSSGVVGVNAFPASVPRLISRVGNSVLGAFNFHVIQNPGIVKGQIRRIEFLPQIVTTEGFETIHTSGGPDEPRIVSMSLNGVQQSNVSEVEIRSNFLEADIELIVEFPANLEVNIKPSISTVDPGSEVAE